MKVVKTKNELIDLIENFRKENSSSIGFVPTMGYLHKGHGSLVEKSVAENKLTVVSIFVNPLQFNDKKDYLNYPKDFDKDISYLEKLNCDIVYIPDYEDIYPHGHKALKYNFGELETVMEGKHRFGHFQGVAEVVRILFEIVKPDFSYFGEKDFQQLRIIQKLVEDFEIPVKIIPFPIIRESDGLAMSSRNSRLTKEERELAPFIYKQLLWCKENIKNYNPENLKKQVEFNFSQIPDFKLEYIEFASLKELKTIQNWDDSDNIGAFIAVHLGKVRLIDNLFLFCNFAE